MNGTNNYPTAYDICGRFKNWTLLELFKDKQFNIFSIKDELNSVLENLKNPPLEDFEIVPYTSSELSLEKNLLLTQLAGKIAFKFKDDKTLCDPSLSLDVLEEKQVKSHYLTKSFEQSITLISSTEFF